MMRQSSFANHGKHASIVWPSGLDCGNGSATNAFVTIIDYINSFNYCGRIAPRLFRALGADFSPQNTSTYQLYCLVLLLVVFVKSLCQHGRWKMDMICTALLVGKREKKASPHIWDSATIHSRWEMLLT